MTVRLATCTDFVDEALPIEGNVFVSEVMLSAHLPALGGGVAVGPQFRAGPSP